jgi:hypothetical protein
LEGWSTAATTTDFGDPLSFAPSGPVFNLPPGWTANSISSNIVDNRFVGLSTVPEPSALILFGIGALPLLGMGVAFRRKGARRGPVTVPSDGLVRIEADPWP